MAQGHSGIYRNGTPTRLMCVLRWSIERGLASSLSAPVPHDSPREARDRETQQKRGSGVRSSQHAAERMRFERLAEFEIFVQHGIALVTAELLEAGVHRTHELAHPGLHDGVGSIRLRASVSMPVPMPVIYPFL
jgi:hypothetical protein